MFEYLVGQINKSTAQANRLKRDTTLQRLFKNFAWLN